MRSARAPAPGALADVALLLEGTYPFVRGGVAMWVHQLIRALPEISFSLVFIGARRSDHGAPAFELPPNVRELVRHYLFDPVEEGGTHRHANSDELFGRVGALHAALRGGAAAPAGSGALDHVAHLLCVKDGLRIEDFLRGEPAWRLITEAYAHECPDGSFLDFFWTIRTMHAPIFGLAKLAERLPPARVYHAISTGYAGFLGALLHRRHGRPLILTEHGIYTKERKIDLASAEHLPGDGEGGQQFGRRLWVRFFEGLGRIAYASADPIISLYDGNMRRQLQDGAAPTRVRVIPNGIDLERFRPLGGRRPSPPPLVVGLLGRVVPIKDVKTFIRSVRLLRTLLPGVRGLVVGPTEDEAYHAECVQLAAALGLEGQLEFTGFLEPEAALPRLGLLVLTSISEALPLVILEALAGGLPVVATDVGACRELLLGRTAADRALGAAGVVVPIADPEATARAAASLLGDPARWQAAGEAGARRVEVHYARRQVIDAYREIYAEAASWPA